VSSTGRALGAEVWGRKVARLPDEGVLLVATDMQGNLADYEQMKRHYLREKAEGNAPVLAFCGDLVHGPGEELHRPGAWPEHLGTPYRDDSPDLLRDFDELTRTERVFSLLGNHEHAHVGGPIVSKFHADEASVLEARLGEDRERIRELLRSFPLVAVSRAGVVLTHAAPRATEPDLEAFERLAYDGFGEASVQEMYDRGTVGALLWARAATPERARALLAATSIDGRPNAFVAYGHDVVLEGYDMVGAEQICVSTSFGLADARKVYLRLDLSHRYEAVTDLREGVEILPLY